MLHIRFKYYISKLWNVFKAYKNEVYFYREVWPFLFEEVYSNSDDKFEIKVLFFEFEIAVAIIYLKQNASENKVLYNWKKLKTSGIIL